MQLESHLVWALCQKIKIYNNILIFTKKLKRRKEEDDTKWELEINWEEGEVQLKKQMNLFM